MFLRKSKCHFLWKKSTVSYYSQNKSSRVSSSSLIILIEFSLHCLVILTDYSRNSLPTPVLFSILCIAKNTRPYSSAGTYPNGLSKTTPYLSGQRVRLQNESMTEYLNGLVEASVADKDQQVRRSKAWLGRSRGYRVVGLGG